MEKVNKVIKLFISNLKEYVNYLMQVDFKELFVNTVILFCLVVLSAFVYIPVSVIRDLIQDLVRIFVDLGPVVSSLYGWVFSLVSFILAFFAFMILFNMRFADVKKAKTENKVIVKEKNSDSKEIEMELPKAKK